MTIDVEGFKNTLLTLLPEEFGVSDSPNGYLLDDGHSGVLATIDQLDAATASAGLKPGNATIAAHTNHILLLLDLFVAYDNGEQPHADWEGSWKVQQVDAAAWDALRAKVRSQYNLAIERVKARTEWPEPAVGGAIILLTHVAYHLGEIKQLVTALNSVKK